MEDNANEYINLSEIQDYIGVTNPDKLKNYFREIFKDLTARNEDSEKKYITKIMFIEFINLPIIISEKLFLSFDRDKDGCLNLKEFAKNLLNLYTGSFEDITELIFNLVDFDHDGLIIPQDVKLLLSYLPLTEKIEYNFQMASLKEIETIIKGLFDNKKELNLREFTSQTENHHSDVFFQILCFLYERKPFTSESLALMEKKKPKHQLRASPQKYRQIPSAFNPSKKSIPSPNRRSLLSPIRFLLEMRNSPSKEMNNSIEMPTPFNLDGNIGSNSTKTLNEVSKRVHEDYLLKRGKKEVFKSYYVVLTGKDMYYFSNKNKVELEGMHHLSGCYIKKVSKVQVGNETYYSFTIQFKQKPKVYYTKTEASAVNWHRCLESAIGNLDFKNFYEIKDQLGEGKFGKVKLCENKNTQMEVATKIIKKNQMMDSDLELLHNELDIMKIVHHPNIVSLIDLFDSSEKIFIVMDYYCGGDLSTYFNSENFNISERKMANFIYQISKGIQYLHEFGIVHRDLKPDNIMLSDTSENPTLKVMDFGLSKIMGVREKAEDGFGTLSFVAPEVLMRSPYNREIDIWSIGVIIYYGLTGCLPFDDEDGDEEKIAKKIVFQEVKFIEKDWAHRSPEVVDLINKCLLKDPNKRITIEGLLNHNWLKKYVKD